MSSIDLRDLIAVKRDGGTLDDEQIAAFVHAAATDSAPEVHLAAMLMAIFCRGMSDAERTAYSLAMMNSGEVLAWDHLDRPTADKHSTGGVGDKVSLIWAPLMAEIGFAVPMISGRGLGHTGGTLDKLEAIPGFRTDLTSKEMDAVVRDVGCVITGQTANLVPADRTLYALRSRTATVPTVDHIAPSIMSKKLAEGAMTLVLDVKVGSGAFMKERKDAEHLAAVMVAIGRGAGRNVEALLSDMSTPLGRAVGNAVEVEESVAVLRGDGPEDLRGLTIDLAEAAVRASGEAERLGLPTASQDLRARLETTLDDGSAFERFRAMVAAQGGDVLALAEPALLRGAYEVVSQPVLAERDGVVVGLDALDVGLAAAALGGGRGADGQAPHPGVGVTLDVQRGDTVQAGQPWAHMRVSGSSDPDAARRLLARAIQVMDEQ